MDSNRRPAPLHDSTRIPRRHCHQGTVVRIAVACVFGLGLTALSASAQPALLPPTNLQATVNGNSVSASWTASASPGVVTYVVQVGRIPGASDLVSAPIGNVTQVSGVVPGGTYYWRLIAIFAQGQSAPSTESTFTVGCTAPGAPESLRALVNGSRVTLLWSPPRTGDQPLDYVVEAGSNTELANLAVVSAGNALSFAADAPPGTYFVRVRARTACGTGAASNETIVVVSGEPSPCTLSVAPQRVEIPVGGSDLVLDVDTPSGCRWQTLITVPWIVPASAVAGTGRASVRFLVLPNPGSLRFVDIDTRGEQSNVITTVRQPADQGLVPPPAPCVYRLLPNATQLPLGGGYVEIVIDTTANCDWIISGPTWLSLDPPSGVGRRTVRATAGDHGAPNREGLIELSGSGAIERLNVSQPGSPAPLIAEFSPFDNEECRASETSPGRARLRCSFNGRLSSPVDRINSYVWDINHTPATGEFVPEGLEIDLPRGASQREVKLTIRDVFGTIQEKTHSIRFSVDTGAAPPCTPGTPSPPSQEAMAAGGMFEIHFSSAVAPGCSVGATWTPHVLGVNWIRILGPNNFSGGGTVQYVVERNTTNTPRSGTISFVSSSGIQFLYTVTQLR